MNFWILFFSLVFILISLGLAFYVFWKKSRKKFSSRDQIFFHDRFHRLEAILSDDPRFAALEADKLFDHALTLLGYEGSFGEKLHVAESLFRDVHGLWSAHKLRNLIAHEVDHTVTVKEARNALRAFKIAFRDLGVDL